MFPSELVWIFQKQPILQDYHVQPALSLTQNGLKIPVNCNSIGISLLKKELFGEQALINVNRNVKLPQIIILYKGCKQKRISESSTLSRLTQLGYSSRRPRPVLLFSDINRKLSLRFPKDYRNLTKAGRLGKCCLA